jgi:hypothetical protein
MEGIKKLFAQKLHCFAATNDGEIDPGYRYRVNNYNKNSNVLMPLYQTKIACFEALHGNTLARMKLFSLQL